jgi:hypothetical protein
MFESDDLPERADFIALISFGSTASYRLTNGSWATTECARPIAHKHNIPIIGGTYFDNPAPDNERVQKEKTLGDRFIWVGKVSSTTDECEAIKKEVEAQNISCNSIIVVDEEFHSLRTRSVWRHYFPEAKLSFFWFQEKKRPIRKTPCPFKDFGLCGFSQI